MAALKVYADRVSEPVRAVILFCKLNGIEFEEVKIDLFKHENHSPEYAGGLNGIEFEEVKIDLFKHENHSPEYAAINPMKTVPAIAHGDFKLLESHAILIYLASAFPGVADHWYPADLFSRAKLHSVLDWHHSNLRCGALGYVINSVLAPRYGLSLNPQTAAECDKILVASLSKIESFWLQGNGKFLLGNDQPSIADLSLVSEIMQLEVLEEKERIRILDPFKKVQRWIQDVKDATRPHFDEVHEVLFETAAIIDKQRAENI